MDLNRIIRKSARNASTRASNEESKAFNLNGGMMTSSDVIDKRKVDDLTSEDGHMSDDDEVEVIKESKLASQQVVRPATTRIRGEYNDTSYLQNFIHLPKYKIGEDMLEFIERLENALLILGTKKNRYSGALLLALTNDVKASKIVRRHLDMESK